MRFVYHAEIGAGIEAHTPRTGREAIDELFPEDIFNPEDENSPNSVWNIIENRYNPNSIQAFINKTADEIIPSGTTLIDKNRLVSDSVSNYRLVYEDVRIKFFASSERLKARFDTATDRIKNKTKKELNLLRDAIERDTNTKDKSADISKTNQDLAVWLNERTNLVSKNKIKNRFEKYTDSMNQYYLNHEWQSNRLRNINEREPWNKYFQGIPIVFPFIEKNKAIKKYGELAESFQKNMRRKISAKVEYALSEENMNEETLINLQKSIENEYAKYANLDGKPGMIDFRDLLLLEYYSSGNTSVLEKINTNDETALRAMEATQLMNEKSWKEVIDSTKNALLRDVMYGSAEGQFIEAVNKWRAEGDPPITDFKEARKYFEERMNTYGKTDVEKMLAFVKHFDSIVNKNRVEALSTVSPPSLQLLVYYERERMLKGQYELQSEYDKILVSFIASDRKGRERILDNPAERAKLFQAIRNAQVIYTDEYANKYQKSIPENIGDLKTRSRDREKPTFHDRAARLQALIVLSKEAEGMIANFGGNEKYKNLDEEFGLVKAEEKVLIGLQFKDRQKPQNRHYSSTAFRGGFNGRDLGVKALKIAGAITVVVNIASSIRQGFENAKGSGGKDADIFDKIGQSLEYAVFNPAVAAGAATAIGAHTLESHPQFYSYIREGEFGKNRIIATARLENLSKKFSDKRLKNFIGNESEWQAMNKLEADQIKNLIKNSQDRARSFKPPRTPGITQEDVENLIGDKNITVNMDKRSADLRFNFYSKFLSGGATNISQLQDICANWG